MLAAHPERRIASTQVRHSRPSFALPFVPKNPNDGHRAHLGALDGFVVAGAGQWGRADAVRGAEALTRLFGQLAFVFRGNLSFWTAGELPDKALGTSARRSSACCCAA